MDATIKEVIEELKHIRKDVTLIKKAVVDTESYLTPSEVKLLKDSLEDEEKGRLLTSKELRKKLGL